MFITIETGRRTLILKFRSGGQGHYVNEMEEKINDPFQQASFFNYCYLTTDDTLPVFDGRHNNKNLLRNKLFLSAIISQILF